MAEEVTIVIKGENKASGPIGEAQKSITGLESAADKSSKKMGEMGGGLSNMASFASRAAGPLAIATAGIVAFQQGLSKAIELNAKLGAFQAIEGDLKQAMLNTGIAASVAEQQFDSLAVAVREMSEQTGVKVSELNGAMRELVTRTGDASAAQENLARVMALMNMTGRSSTDSARALGNALNGQLGPLAELGILTQEQVKQFQGMEDKALGVSKAMEILDQKTKGFAKGLPESEAAAGRLGAAMERLEVSFAKLAGVEFIVGAVASALEWAVEPVEEYAEAWTKGAQTITQAMQEIEAQSRGLNVFIDTTSEQFQREVGESAIKSITQQFEQQKFLREEMLQQGLIDHATFNAEIERLDEDMFWRLEAIRAERGINDEKILDTIERQIEREAQKALQMGEQSDEARFQLQTQALLNELSQERLRTLAEETDEVRRRNLEELFQLRQQNVEAERRQQFEKQFRRPPPAPVARRERAVDPAAIIAQAQKEAEAAQKKAEAEADAAAALERRNAIATARMALLREEDVLVRANLEATIKELELEGRKLTDLEREFELASINFELEKTRADFERETNEARMAALEAERVAKDAAIKQEEERLAATYAANTEIIRGLDQAIPGLGQLAAGLRTVAEQQRQNADASEAAMSALGGLTSMGGQLANMITKDRKKAAKVEAGFHAAAAIGAFAAWAASSFTLAQYGVAAAQHGVAAVKFGMVAGSGGASQTPSRGGGGGGGGGGAGMLARDRAATSNQQAKPADIVINVDMGSSTNLRSAVDTGREIGQSVADAARNEFRL